MTNLELVEHDLTPCGHGLPVRRTVVAMSTSATALKNYCKDTYGMDVGHHNIDNKEIYYTIHQSNVKIIQFDYESNK